MAYSWQQRYPSSFWTIRYWLYAICSFLRTGDERRLTNDAFDALFREALERRALPSRSRFIKRYRQCDFGGGLTKWCRWKLGAAGFELVHAGFQGRDVSFEGVDALVELGK
jgi:hypothetical protein